MAVEERPIPEIEVEVRLDDSKATNFDPARPSVSPSWPSAGRRRPNFVAARLTEIENRSQPTRNPGNVGLESFALDFWPIEIGRATRSARLAH